MTLFKKAAVPLVLVALIVAAGLTFVHKADQKTLTAHFPRTLSLYAGSDVRVLGVPVGKVDSVTPTGTDVTVTMHYDDDITLPADAKAVIIAPSIVGDRYVQLTPAYTGGAKMADGASLSTSQTAVPLELDDIYSSIDQLTVALGPNGANADGALTDLLEQTAANFGGQGAKFHQTIGHIGQLTSTLDDNKDELFGSAKKLEGFIHTLASNDGTVRRFNQSLAGVSSELRGERQELAGSLKNLSVSLGQVASYVKQNKGVLSRNIKGLNEVGATLVKQRAALNETLEDAPLALNNLYLTYNPDAGTLDTNSNIGHLIDQITTDPALTLCTIAESADQSGSLCNVIKSVLPRTSPLGEGAAATTKPYDPTLGGLVPVTK